MTLYIHCHIILMMQFDWNPVKNEELKLERGVSFDDVVLAIHKARILDDIKHPNPKKYANQRVYIIEINEYAYIVPYVQSTKKVVFLKTIIPSRKMTKQYLR